MERRSRDVCGIPLWLLRAYLVEAGGRETGAAEVSGEGWKATLVELADHRIGGLAVGQVRVELEGTEDVLDALEARLAPKFLRGGG
jgi:hypothetical protein